MSLRPDSRPPRPNPLYTWIHAHLRLLSLTILGSLAGATAGLLLGRAILMHAATISLSAYARDLSLNADTLADEINTIFTTMNAPGPPLCSAPDIERLKTETFRTTHVKDIGRTHLNKLYCSAFLGRLSHLYVEGPPTLALADGLNIFTNVAVLLASSGDGRGTIVDAGDVNVVLNGNAFGNWARPHLSYMIVAVDRPTARMLPIAGSNLPVDLHSILHKRTQIIHGTIFQSICSSRHPVCVVAAEPVAAVWSLSRSTLIAYAAMGGFAGLSLGLLTFVFYKRTTSLSYQLLRAIRRDSPSFSLVYQPIIDIASGRCTGAEALLRWRDHNGASIPPDVFIPLAEENGFITLLTALVVRRATSDLLDLLLGCEDFKLSLNIAAADLGDPHFFSILHQHVVLAGIRPAQIALELTERSTADLIPVSAAIQRLCSEGYKVHIDDFGVGFSSLSYLDQLRVNAIKIDRTFTRTIGTDAVIAPILSQMLDMAQCLGVEVVVEGVETEFQRDYLAATGIPLNAQGWYFSKPLSPQILRTFNRENKALHHPRPTKCEPATPYASTLS